MRQPQATGYVEGHDEMTPNETRPTQLYKQEQNIPHTHHYRQDRT
jgi:hypothetical protein